MGGVVALSKVARTAGGALAELYADIGRKWGSSVAEASPRVGEAFRALAQDPKYSVTGSELRTGDDITIAKWLARKHDLDLKSDGMGGLAHRETGTSISPTGDTPFSLEHGTGRSNFTGNQLGQSTLDKLGFSKLAGMGPNSPFHEIDMIGAQQGAGMAKRLYSAYGDWLLSHPGEKTLTSSLTMENAQKRGIHQAALMEKYGDRARNLIQPQDIQLDSAWGAAHNEGPFMRSDIPSQVGALNMINANNTQAKIHELMGYAKEKMEKDGRNLASSNDLADYMAHGDLTGAYTAAQKKGLGESSWLSTNDDLKSISDIIRELAGRAGVAQPVGYDSLRRSAITNDILRNPGMDVRDLKGSELTRGLAMAKGGPVPPHGKHVGPLSQCSCGA
jgi:hypothetical protein